MVGGSDHFIINSHASNLWIHNYNATSPLVATTILQILLILLILQIATKIIINITITCFYVCVPYSNYLVVFFYFTVCGAHRKGQAYKMHIYNV